MPRPGKWQRTRNSARVRKRWQFTGRGPVTFMARALGSRRAPRRTRPPSIATVAVGSSRAAASSRCSSGLVSRTQRSPSCRPTHAHATPSSACMEQLDETNGSMSASVSSRTERRPAWVSTNGMEHNELTDQGSMYTCHGTSVTVLFSHVPFHFSHFTCAKAPYRQYLDVTVDASLQRRSLAPQFAPSRPSRAHRWWWPASSTRSQRNLQRFER